MIDPIKKFVEENREAFDHREPPVDALKLLKNRLKAQAAGEEEAIKEEKKIVPLFSRTQWLVAASILLAITVTFIFSNRKNTDVDKLANQQKPKATTEIPVHTDLQKKEQEPEVLAKTTPSHPVERTMSDAQDRITAYSSQQIQSAVPAIASTKDLYARLADSSSSTVRLSAILEIGKSNRVNLNTLDILAKTLNNDSNSNVRLAALDVMGKYAFDKHASSLLVGSLSTQNDPLVQLGLIAILGKLDNVKIDDRLFALADDPNTFGAVKEEAYTVLLNQNKL